MIVWQRSFCLTNFPNFLDPIMVSLVPCDLSVAQVWRIPCPHCLPRKRKRNCSAAPSWCATLGGEKKQALVDDDCSCWKGNTMGSRFSKYLEPYNWVVNYSMRLENDEPIGFGAFDSREDWHRHRSMQVFHGVSKDGGGLTHFRCQAGPKCRCQQ